VNAYSPDLFMRTNWRGEIGLAGDPTSAREARAFVRMALEDQVDGETLQDLMLLASELVSNVIRHARTPLTVCVESHRTSVVITVTDGAVTFDAGSGMAPADDSEDGRGMGIIASLSRRWGVGDTPVGKSIWAEVATA
jgi:anti-sigma regulatory factor (Ser/Thr protein kinase)